MGSSPDLLRGILKMRTTILLAFVLVLLSSFLGGCCSSGACGDGGAAKSGASACCGTCGSAEKRGGTEKPAGGCSSCTK